MPRLNASTLLPGVARLRGYQRRQLPGDIFAGLLVAALAVPQALGYAAVAGVPVQVGLYTIPPALLAYVLFGSSRVLFMGPVSTVTVLSGSIVRGLAGGDVAAAVAMTNALAVLAGIVLLAAGLLRVGWVAQFLSAPIVTGFVTGLVVLIVVGEIPGVLGVSTPGGALLERIVGLAQSVPNAQPATLAVAVGALVLLFGGSKLAPRLPWSLIVLVLGIVASQLLDLRGQGAAVVGAVPAGVPLPHLPIVPISDIGSVATGAFAIAAVGMAEGLAAANHFASVEDDLVDDSEFIANGAADVAAGLFGGMGVAGSLSKTAANARAGASTQVSSIAGAVAVLLVLLFATGLLAPLPKAVLSAIVIHAVWGLVQPSRFRQYLKIRRNDFAASVVALLGVLLAGPLNGLIVAIAQSLLGLIYRSMQVHIDEMGKVPGEKAAWGAIAHDPARKTVRRICVLRPDGPLFWANAAEVITRIEHLVAERTDARALLLDLEATNQLDTTTAERLSEMVKRMRDDGVEVYFVRVFGNVRTVLQRAGIFDLVGEGRLWHSISAGVKAAKADVTERRHQEVFDPGDVWDPFEDQLDQDEDAWLEQESADGEEEVIRSSLERFSRESSQPQGSAEPDERHWGERPA